MEKKKERNHLYEWAVLIHSVACLWCQPQMLGIMNQEERKHTQGQPVKLYELNQCLNCIHENIWNMEIYLRFHMFNQNWPREVQWIKRSKKKWASEAPRCKPDPYSATYGSSLISCINRNRRAFMWGPMGCLFLIYRLRVINSCILWHQTQVCTWSLNSKLA